MRTQVITLYERGKTKYQMALHDGTSGLHNSASWVYLAEDIQNISFLKGGEFIITTGLFVRSGVALSEFIRALAMCSCSGILLNVGPYLREEDITPEISEFCDYNKIPLFTMPWEVHLVDIMQDFCGLFLSESRQEEHLSATFQSAIYHTPVPDGILRTFNQFGFATRADYQAIVIRNLQDTTQITSPFNSYGFKYHLFTHDNHHILIYNASQKQLSLSALLEIICFYDGIKAGVSDTAPSLADIGLSYRRARFALDAADFWKRPYVCFDELGLLQLLFSVPDHSLMQAVYKRRLGVLEKYDGEHGTEYLDTLRIFLLSDCNLLETSARMHTHRNTVVYRVKKIKELLASSLDNSAVKFDLMMALYIREYLSISPQ
ncbi:PucR C-terminal helix-turn-helix domain-containing protein [Sporobacter termitidis DSM 10068]|uniref:PucR C-terminal helix-turn-helix domain-containing protein n=1 Tax=Sporobacter termitidis DSM 10068 TaxID=1123282 RepID=A0A1M5Y5A1_9FIRM|nr:PucR family transcriptional regulator ligand-binding domain-containing protein [Sporobacter termitidis]SHI07099.1 PucR C-terminal helix-turn-helix domain-containing protein [Sporobacter termitidis DSM 10068]